VPLLMCTIGLLSCHSSFWLALVTNLIYIVIFSVEHWPFLCVLLQHSCVYVRRSGQFHANQAQEQLDELAKHRTPVGCIFKFHWQTLILDIIVMFWQNKKARKWQSDVWLKLQEMSCFCGLCPFWVISISCNVYLSLLLLIAYYCVFLYFLL